MLKKNTILILLLGTLLGLSSCGVTPGPKFYNGNYYWIDSNCVQARTLTATSIECRNSDNEETGYRNAMTNQEIQAYKYQQQKKKQEFQEFMQALDQFNEGLAQSTRTRSQRRNTTNAYKFTPPTSSYNSYMPSNEPSGYSSSFGNKYKYDLNRPLDRLRYNIDPKAKLRDRLDINPQRRIEQNTGQYGGGVLKNKKGSQW
jgi:hypothetical protein